MIANKGGHRTEENQRIPGYNESYQYMAYDYSLAEEHPGIRILDVIQTVFRSPFHNFITNR